MCRFCKKYKTCDTLCDNLLQLLSNSKKKNDIYSDYTVSSKNISFDSNILDKILYTRSISNDTYIKAEHIIIAILTPEQKHILTLISEEKNQEEIGKTLKITQSAVSQKLKAIKKEIKDQFTEIIDLIM